MSHHATHHRALPHSHARAATTGPGAQPTIAGLPTRRTSRLRRLRERQWSAAERAAVIAVVAIVMGCLFIATYSLALGDPVPHRIDAALVGDETTHAHTVDAVQGIARDSLVFRRYASVPAALHAIGQQHVYAALDLTAKRPTLYVASAAGASVARVLERIDAVDPTVRVVDTHPLAANDPNGLDLFYRMLVATIIGFIAVFQVLAHAPGLLVRHHARFVMGLAVAGSLALTLVGGVLLHGFAASDPEQWAILALHLLAVASFSSLMAVVIGRWAILPTWLFFVILGNTSSGGAVSPPLLPPPSPSSRDGCPPAQPSPRSATPSTSLTTSTRTRSPSWRSGRRRSSPRGSPSHDVARRAQERPRTPPRREGCPPGAGGLAPCAPRWLGIASRQRPVEERSRGATRAH
jgi:hypothetical protein